MGKKLDALLGRTFKSSKFKTLVNLALSRLTVLKNQRQARSSIAGADIVQLLTLGHHDRALLRVEQVMKEQNMLDVFVTLEGYCVLVLERINLIEQEKVCPEELKEAVSSLLYAATRCGEFPELQEMRAVFTRRFGKEFTARAIELRNNCGVNPQVIQKLSTRQPNLESRLKVLKEIAAENNIVLQIQDVTTEEKPGIDQTYNQPTKAEKPANLSSAKLSDNLDGLTEQMGKVEGLSDSMKLKRQYKDVADAAQAAFESAAYAALAARAAVELSRSESHDPDDQNSPTDRPKEEVDKNAAIKSEIQAVEDKNSRKIANAGAGFEKVHPIQNQQSGPEDEETDTDSEVEEFRQNENVAGFKRTISDSSSNSTEIPEGYAVPLEMLGHTKPAEKEILFDESEDETINKQGRASLPRTSGLRLNTNPSLPQNQSLVSEKFEDENLLGRKEVASQKQFPLRSPPRKNRETVSFIEYSSDSAGKQIAQHSKAETKPVSVRTRRGLWQ